jgi:excisionase family DNA binding protein
MFMDKTTKSNLEDEPILLLSIKQVAHRLQVSERTVRRMDVPCYRIGRAVRYKIDDVDKFVNRCVEYSHKPTFAKPPRPRQPTFVGLPRWEEARAMLKRRKQGNG